MKKVCVFTILTLALALAGATALAGTYTTHYLTHDSVQRDYIKYVPSNLPTGDVPLVMILHGGTQGASAMFDATAATLEWTVIADEEGFIVAAPNGIEGNWHDCRSDAHPIIGTADDVGFIQAVIDDVDADEGIDLDAVFAGGSSNGGMMTLRLYLEASADFAAFYSCIANRPIDPSNECQSEPDYARPIVMIHGTGDTNYMPYNGGYVTGDSDRGEVEAAEDTVDFFVGFMNCSTTPTTRTYTNLSSSDGGVVDRYDYTSCDSSTTLVWLKANGHGHMMPSIDYRISWLVRVLLGLGNQNADIESAREIWAVWENYL